MPNNMARIRRLENRESAPRQRVVSSKTAAAAAGQTLNPSAADDVNTSMTSSTNCVIDSKCWAPSTSVVFKLVMSVRICSALWSNISDCDETYNYWEPLHMLLYGDGMQTWEYSPVYALRSYLYVWFHALPALLYRSLVPPTTPIALFYLIRCSIAALTTISEVLLYKTLLEKLSRNVARYWFAFNVAAPGMFISAAAFLPSSFSMSLGMLAMTCWLRRSYFLAVCLTALSALAGWPFAALLGLPIAIDLALIRREWKEFVTHSALAGGCIAFCMIKLDGYYYGVGTLAPINIVLYNVFSGKGPSLYGEEPWSYYVINLLLNHNLAVILAAAAPFLTLYVYAHLYLHKSPPQPTSFLGRWTAFADIGLIQVALFAWLAVFFNQKHKEERFMFPIYPLITLAAALSLDSIERIFLLTPRNSDPLVNRLQRFLAARQIKISRLLTVCYTFIFVTFYICSLSRSVALYRNYHSVFDSYMDLGSHLLEDEAKFHSSVSRVFASSQNSTPIRVCVGKEWHRFPSSFFFPAKGARLEFIKSDFKGLLPKPYPEHLPIPEKTRQVPTEMNDANREEPSRYVSIKNCNYLIDFSTSKFLPAGQHEPDYALDPAWTLMSSRPFLIAQLSNKWTRAFFIPQLSNLRNVFGSYVVLKRTKASPTSYHSTDTQEQ